MQELLNLDKWQTDELEQENPQTFVQGLIKSRNEFPVPLWRIPSNQAVTEQCALEELTARKCSVTPKLLGLVRMQQGKDLGVGMPEGYLQYVLMQKVPGVSLSRVWRRDLPLEEKKRIRRACAEAWKELWSCGYTMLDTNKGNLLWDAANEKIFIVDTEDFKPVKTNNKDRNPEEIEEQVETMLDLFDLLDDVEEIY